MPKTILLSQKQEFFKRIDAGYSYRAAAKAAGFSLSTAQVLMKGQRVHARTALEAGRELKLSDPIPYAELSPEAKRGWDDFAYFQQRYFGRIPIPWQTEAAERAQTLLDSPDEEFLCVNCPPGVGKTMLFTHDIPLWLTVRNRAIRGQYGAVTTSLASKYLRTVRSTLGLTIPMQATPKGLTAGTELDAVATLAGDYGRFRPLERDLWTNEAFIVLQHGGAPIRAKEATWSAYGIEAGFIGGRYDFIVWDDLVDPKKHRSEEARRQLEGDWDDLCETRLEPSGLLILQGQRLYPDDLYHYNVAKVVPEDIDEETGEVFGSQKKYHHIKFPAHFDGRCSEGSHAVHAKPYPEGCLLAPTRLGYRRLMGVKMDPNSHYEIVYQQEDVDPTDVLVPLAWVEGDDANPGCLDRDRSRLEVPGKGAMSGFVSLITVDPSPTKNWSIQWWLYHHESEQYFLMELINKRMEAPDWLGYNIAERQFYGHFVDIVNIAAEKGQPITHLIVEQNAAQRFMQQYDHFKTFMRTKRIQFIPHTTSRNKSDAEFGVETIAPYWRFGHIRLPYSHDDRFTQLMSRKLIFEVTHYMGDPPDDNIMAEWFMHWNIDLIWHPPKKSDERAWRPGWVSGIPSKNEQAKKALFGAAKSGYEEKIRSAV